MQAAFEMGTYVAHLLARQSRVKHKHCGTIPKAAVGSEGSDDRKLKSVMSK